MAKHIGIVACSAEGAALCYRTICIEGQAEMGEYNHPEVSMHTRPLADYMNCIYENDWSGVASLMLSSSEKLKSIGAEFAICPDNTIHQAMDEVLEKMKLPWLHIAEEVAKEAKRRGVKRPAVLGTRYLMEGPVYVRYLNKAGIDREIPDPHDRNKINTYIFDELVNGIFHDHVRDYFYETIGRMKKKGCDAVILGCTEIPLIVDPEKSPLPTLDSTRILARAALKYSIG